MLRTTARPTCSNHASSSDTSSALESEATLARSSHSLEPSRSHSYFVAPLVVAFGLKKKKNCLQFPPAECADDYGGLQSSRQFPAAGFDGAHEKEAAPNICDASLESLTFGILEEFFLA